MHAATYNTFTVCRHLISARTHRLFRAEAFAAWRNAAGGAPSLRNGRGLSLPTGEKFTEPM